MSNVSDTVALTEFRVQSDLESVQLRPASRSALPFARYDWSSTALYIMMAGAAYPLTLILLFTSMATIASIPDLIANGFDAAALGNFLMVAVMVVIYGVLLGGIIGFLWSGFVSLFVLPVMYLIARSLRINIGFIPLSAFCGGVVGFISVSPVIASMTTGPGLDWDMAGWILAIGPGLTTILGQLGGAIGGRREVLLNRAADPPDEPEPSKNRPLQFGIRQLLWMSVWLSLLLTAIRWGGARMELILPVLLGWIVYQCATLSVGWAVAARAWPRWRAWRAARRST